MRFIMVQTIHVCGRTLEAYSPDLVHWNRIRVGCLVMYTLAVLLSSTKKLLEIEILRAQVNMNKL